MVNYRTRRLVIVALMLLACALMVFDHTARKSGPRVWLNQVMSSFLPLLTKPSQLLQALTDGFESRSQQSAALQILRAQKSALNVDQLTMASLRAENARLRRSLQLKQRGQAPGPMLAQVVLSVNSPYGTKLMLDQGRIDGVERNAIVIDELGIVGQIDEVYEHHSLLILIADPSHQLPVRVLPTNTSAIVQAHGDLFQLSLQYIPQAQPPKLGSQVVTSGLGGRFPVGYPVGIITAVEESEQGQFARIELRPSANLDQLDLVYILPPREPELSESMDLSR